jgi:hypothetical protein
MACIKRRVCDLQIGAETERLPCWEPTRREKVVQDVERNSLGVPQRNTKERVGKGGVVEAAGQKNSDLVHFKLALDYLFKPGTT